jgi:hypothetical protein
VLYVNRRWWWPSAVSRRWLCSQGENGAAGEDPDDGEQEAPGSLRSEHCPVDQRGQAHGEADPGEPPRQHPPDQPDRRSGDNGHPERQHSQREQGAADLVQGLMRRRGLRRWLAVYSMPTLIRCTETRTAAAAEMVGDSRAVRSRARVATPAEFQTRR